MMMLMMVKMIIPRNNSADKGENTCFLVIRTSPLVWTMIRHIGNIFEKYSVRNTRVSVKYQ